MAQAMGKNPGAIESPVGAQEGFQFLTPLRGYFVCVAFSTGLRPWLSSFAPSGAESLPPHPNRARCRVCFDVADAHVPLADAQVPCDFQTLAAQANFWLA